MVIKNHTNMKSRLKNQDKNWKMNSSTHSFTPSNLIEKISLTFGDRHEHIDFDDFMPMKKHMKKCEDIIIESIKKKKS